MSLERLNTRDYDIFGFLNLRISNQKKNLINSKAK